MLENAPRLQQTYESLTGLLNAMRDAHEARIIQLKTVSLDNPSEIEALVNDGEASLQQMERTLELVAKALPPRILQQWNANRAELDNWIAEERAIMTLSSELARELSQRAIARRNSDTRFAPFRASLDTLGEQVDSRLLSANSSTDLSNLGQAISLVLNADRDSYQAIMAENSIVEQFDTDTAAFESLLQDYTANMDQIRDRLTKANQLISGSESLGFSVVLSLYDKWRTESMQTVAITNRILQRLRERSAHERHSGVFFRASQAWLAKIHADLKQIADEELAEYEAARDEAMRTSDQIRSKANEYLIVFNALALLAFLCFLLLIVFQRRLVANLLGLSGYLSKLDEDRLKVPYTMPKQRFFPSQELSDLETNLNAMRERLVEIIDAHKTALQWLTSSEARYSNLFHSSVSPILLLEPETGRVLDANQAAATLYRTDIASLRLSRLAQLESPDVADGLSARLASLSDGQSMSLTSTHLRSDGSTFSAEIYAGIVEDSGDTNALVVINDISERIEFERQLMLAKEGAEAANQAKDEFLSVMSHELRTPLNPIIGYAQLLDRRTKDPTIQQFTTAILTSANRMLGLVESVLYFTQLSHDHHDLAQERFTVAELLAEPRAVVRLQRQADSIVFINGDVPQGLSAVSENEMLQAPKSAITQTLLNILNNAFKYAPNAPIEIVIGSPSDATEPCIQIEIRDRGPGVPPDFVRSLFEPFTQADSTYSRSFEGIGLGLAICRKLVEQMRGRIGYRPNRPQGAVFWFVFPVTPVEHARPRAATRQPLEASPIRSLKPRVLVVEDNPDNAAYLSLALTEIGALSDQASSGAEALSRAAEREFDLALIDISMRDMDGFETFARLKDMPQFGESRACIAVTAHADAAIRKACLEKGFADFLTKPISAADLERALRRALTQTA